MIQKTLFDDEAPPIFIERIAIAGQVADDDPWFFRPFFPVDHQVRCDMRTGHPDMVVITNFTCWGIDSAFFCCTCYRKKASQETAFLPLLSITCGDAKKAEIDGKQRLFPGNAMRTKGAYFAQYKEKINVKYDFVYVASGEAQKNHKTLIQAWIKLARMRMFPSLALTLDEQRFASLCKWIKEQIRVFNLQVLIIGGCNQSDMMMVSRDASAMIYPSLYESLGLPLIEAAFAGLPVLAGRLDYVNDVIQPSEEYDPDSSKSIAEAVVRCTFTQAKLKIKLVGVNEFLKKTMMVGDEQVIENNIV
ncbi:glycosyltransferase [Methylotuvimicrobium sp. KM1]|uniref:glycosyltransferase n=1 Tax=Methylotuvimicrobium sp. KM1 TaxID=3377707 RepID=UPI00384BC558